MPSEIDDFHRNGFHIFDTGISEEELDALILSLGILTGKQGKQYANGRLQDAWKKNELVRKLAVHPNVLEVLEQLYDDKPHPFQTLNFPTGTEQLAHADSIHFNSEPFGKMCGVWVALENISLEQGPLVYYPGSNMLPEMNFDDLGIFPSYKNYGNYEEKISQLILKEHLKPVLGVVRKGSAIIWAANLLHGGSEQIDKTLSRHSQVTHYYFGRIKYWRPGFSKRLRQYFSPTWIPTNTPSPKIGINFRINIFFRKLINKI